MALETALRLRRATDTDVASATARFAAFWQNAEIISRANSLDATGVGAARELGELLTAHVRFEERVLFGLLERALDEDALAALGVAVEAAERPHS